MVGTVKGAAIRRAGYLYRAVLGPKVRHVTRTKAVIMLAIIWVVLPYGFFKSLEDGIKQYQEGAYSTFRVVATAIFGGLIGFAYIVFLVSASVFYIRRMFFPPIPRKLRVFHDEF